MELEGVTARGGCLGALGDDGAPLGEGDEVLASVSVTGRKSSCFGDEKGIGNGETDTAVIVAEWA